MQITSEIWQVGGEGFTAAADAAVYLLRFAGRAAIVDAGCGGHGDRLAANIHALGVEPGQVDYLLLTHCHFDHTGGAADLAARFDCPIVAHELDAGALASGDDRLTAANWYGLPMPPLAVDRILTGDINTLTLGDRQITAIHIPGHTPGSLAYQVDSDGQRVLFGQDVHGPLHADFASDETAYRRSLARLADIGADILCEGHFGVFHGADRVRDFIRSFL
ncbi:Beta-lactamase domain protein [Desulfosarcina cetonica]|uniref:MBL fold metallo-hydrolase n=1 Tax=Desulfosarcina cetonica TaxID=90730 RepID=UPI0006CFC454|nr:MBL fold metallo-hydrolase [Desulfosarcina cetonica]VTR69997.1 Beta-lactamase domain protein [Desulfosarcina cetonica]